MRKSYITHDPLPGAVLPLPEYWIRTTLDSWITNPFKPLELPMRQLNAEVAKNLTRNIIRYLNHTVFDQCVETRHLCVWMCKKGQSIWLAENWPGSEYSGPSCCVQIDRHSTVPSIYKDIVTHIQYSIDDFPDIFKPPVLETEPPPGSGSELPPRLMPAKEARQKVEALDDKQGRALKEEAVKLIHEAVELGKTYVDLPDAPKWSRIGQWLEDHGYEVHCDIGQRGNMYRVKWDRASLAPSPHTEGDDLERIGW